MTYHKYPKMRHLPWSKSVTDDDKKLNDVFQFEQMQEVVVMEKLDGECTTMYHDHIHARSIDSKHHPSRSVVKALHSNIGFSLRSNMALVGENMYAKHSIYYNKLTSHFYVFAVYIEDQNRQILVANWNDTLEYAELLGLEVCPVMYRGPWDEKLIKSLHTGRSYFGDTSEGYVVRTANAFYLDRFASNIAKYVRPNHVQTDEHWLDKPVVPNKLRGE